LLCRARLDTRERERERERGREREREGGRPRLDRRVFDFRVISPSAAEACRRRRPAAAGPGPGGGVDGRVHDRPGACVIAYKSYGDYI
jgi:hypothetical protein